MPGGLMDISKLNSDRVQERQTQETTQSQKSQAAAQKKVENQAAGSAQSTATSRSSDVKWSADAKLATEAMAVAKASPDIRADRVASLKASIADGSYKVDAKALADKMISRSLEDDLLTRNS